jgi:hypothetical protein
MEGQRMNSGATPSSRGWTLELLLMLHIAASLIHFIHNAEFISDYPNLPSWITRANVYAVWLVITAGGALGYAIYRLLNRTMGVVILSVYAAIGLDGLLHYARAPMGAHTHGMNFTIWLEALSAAILMLYLLFSARRVSLGERTAA